MRKGREDEERDIGKEEKMRRGILERKNRRR